VVLKFLFHTWEVKDNEIYKHCFFLTCICVSMLCILQWIW
jgi:hypothetical protein